jgi:glutamate carboxypeptidase
MTSENNHGASFRRYFEEHSQEALELIRWLVEQESMSLVPDATSRIAENLAERIADLGGKIERFEDPRCGTHLLARFNPENTLAGAAGTNGGGSTNGERPKQLLIIGHLDTVWPLGTLAKRPFRIDGDRAFGPGIFDMKSGVGIATFAMKALKETGTKLNRPVSLLLTCDEETGSGYSQELIEEEGRHSHTALVLEPPIPGGKLKTGRKGVGQFELIIRGRPAHAGNDPKAGISAVTELANQILAINKMNDYERGTTVNVGVVSGGVLSNVIAAESHAWIDMRYQVPEEGDRIIEAMSALSPTLKGAKLEVKGGINRPPLVRTPEIKDLFEHARTLAAEIGFELEEGSVGGGSDGNFVAALGVPVLDGLGVDGAGPHAEHEHILISDIPRRAALITRLIQTLSA